MASQRTFFRPLWLKRGSRGKQLISRSSGTSGTTAPPRGNPAQARFPRVGSGLAALAIIGCAFGPVPDESVMIDAAREGVGTQRKTIDNFLAHSRQYFGL